MPYSDPRLIRLYDVDTPHGPDHDFFRGLVRDIRAQRVVDLGCGAGILTVTLAEPGRDVIGIDPSKEALEFARSRPGGGAITWVEGTERLTKDGRLLESCSIDGPDGMGPSSCASETSVSTTAMLPNSTKNCSFAATNKSLRI